jgi:DNA repair exonuclease SbcCD ATPase subunit
MPNAMDTYSEAVEKFKEYSTAAMDNLVKARQAYEEASRASDEIRKSLLSRDESIKSVMTQLQEIAGEHLADEAAAAKLIEMPSEEKEGNSGAPAKAKVRMWP